MHHLPSVSELMVGASLNRLSQTPSNHPPHLVPGLRDSSPRHSETRFSWPTNNRSFDGKPKPAHEDYFIYGAMRQPTSAPSHETVVGGPVFVDYTHRGAPPHFHHLTGVSSVQQLQNPLPSLLLELIPTTGKLQMQARQVAQQQLTPTEHTQQRLQPDQQQQRSHSFLMPTSAPTMVTTTSNGHVPQHLPTSAAGGPMLSAIPLPTPGGPPIGASAMPGSRVMYTHASVPPGFSHYSGAIPATTAKATADASAANLGPATSPPAGPLPSHHLGPQSTQMLYMPGYSAGQPSTIYGIAYGNQLSMPINGNHIPQVTVIPRSDENNALMNKRRVIKRRTRTGCLTCRKRRIKCDERKPHCFNCERSKKLCMGYEVATSVRRRSLALAQESSSETASIPPKPMSRVLVQDLV